VAAGKRRAATAPLEELRDMASRLEAAKAAYYNAEPLMSDAAFDTLQRDFRKRLAAAQSSGVDTSAVRAERALGVGAPVAGGARPSEHSADKGGALLSLAAEHDEAGVRRWFQRSVAPLFAQRQVDPSSVSLVVEPKVDGLTLRATYRGGKLWEVGVEGRSCCSFFPSLPVSSSPFPKPSPRPVIPFSGRHAR